MKKYLGRVELQVRCTECHHWGTIFGFFNGFQEPKKYDHVHSSAVVHDRSEDIGPQSKYREPEKPAEPSVVYFDEMNNFSAEQLNDFVRKYMTEGELKKVGEYWRKIVSDAQGKKQ